MNDNLSFDELLSKLQDLPITKTLIYINTEESILRIENCTCGLWVGVRKLLKNYVVKEFSVSSDHHELTVHLEDRK